MEHRAEFTKHIYLSLGIKLLKGFIDKKTMKDTDIKNVILNATKQSIATLKKFDKTKVYTKETLSYN